MHSIAAAAASHGTSVSSEVVAGIIIVGAVLLVLVVLGWRPRRSRPVSQSPAAAAVRAGRRSAAGAKTRSKAPAPQPEDAA